MSNNQQNQRTNQNLSAQSSNQNLDGKEKKKSAPEYPPATDRSKRTNSANFNEGDCDDDIITF